MSASEPGGTVSRFSAATRQIAAESASESEVSPTVSGNGLKGDILTVTTGIWSGTGSIIYSYQWE